MKIENKEQLLYSAERALDECLNGISKIGLQVYPNLQDT